MDALQLTPSEQRLVENYFDEERQRGLSPHVNLAYLLEEWAAFVRLVEDGYGLSIYDYQEELSGRDMLEELMGALPSIRKKILAFVAPVDKAFLSSTRESTQSVGVLHPRPGVQSWWSYRIPKKLSGELADDLRSRGIE